MIMIIDACLNLFKACSGKVLDSSWSVCGPIRANLVRDKSQLAVQIVTLDA